MFEKDSSYMVGSGSVFKLGFMSKCQHMGPKLCFRGSELFGEICESVNYSMTALGAPYYSVKYTWNYLS